MSIKTFRIISGITTAVSVAACTIVKILNTPKSTLVCGIIVAVAGLVDEVCTLFINDLKPVEAKAA